MSEKHGLHRRHKYVLIYEVAKFKWINWSMDSTKIYHLRSSYLKPGSPSGIPWYVNDTHFSQVSRSRSQPLSHLLVHLQLIMCNFDNSLSLHFIATALVRLIFFHTCTITKVPWAVCTPQGHPTLTQPAWCHRLTSFTHHSAHVNALLVNLNMYP